jgi:hypothetical protein
VFALMLALVTAVALLARATFAASAVLVALFGIAGVTGLFAAVAALSGRTGFSAGPVLVVAGVAIVIAGTAAVLAGTPAEGREPRPHSSLDRLGFACNLAIVPLALGVLGVFHQMMIIGRKL